LPLPAEAVTATLRRGSSAAPELWWTSFTATCLRFVPSPFGGEG
jgi:hypothetical protein